MPSFPISGLPAIAFIEGSAILILLVLYWLLVKGFPARFFRFWMTGWAAGLGLGRFPWGTLLINVLGSLVIGVVAGLTLTPERLGWHPDMRIFLMVGICGGFTTFSAFSLQVVEMIHLGDLGPAFGYVAGSVLLCLGATWAGMLLAR